MVNTFTRTFSKSALAVILLMMISLLGYSQSKQRIFRELAHENSLGIAPDAWARSYSKTMVLLENVKTQSLFNYVVMMADGNAADNSYFKEYAYQHVKKDVEALISKVGKGQITNASGVMNYFSSLQPQYIAYYSEFKKDKKRFIDTQNQLRQLPAGGTTPVPFNCGSPCTNPGFESGTGFWDYSTGTAGVAGTSCDDICSIVAGFSATQHQLETGGNDPVVGAALPMVPPGGGANSMRLGDGTGTGNGASRASISFTVSAANANFTYRYAVVLQDPGTSHTDPERPYFNVQLRDASGNVVPCGEYNVIAKPPITGFSLVTGTTDVYYRPWTTVFVPLSSYIGQCVTIQFTSRDCTQGGHYGYAYIDGDCDPLQIIASSPTVCGGSTVTLTAPAGGAAYSWSNTAGGTTGIVGSITGMTATVNLGGTYQCIVTSVAGPACVTTLNVTIGSNPSNPLAAFTNTTVCAGSATVFTDTSTPAGSATAWAWDYNADGVTDDVIQNPSHTFPAAGTYPVSLTITAGPCTNTIIQNITVNPGVAPAITPAGPFCVDAAAVTLSGTPAGGTWSGTGITGAATGAFDPAAATVGNNAITYSVGGTCPGTVNATILVNALPIAIAGPDVTICSGAAATIGDPAPPAGATYSWSPAIGLSSATASNPSITTVNSGTTPIVTNYTVTITQNTCTATDVVTVTVNPQPVLTITNPPAVCSPNTVDITPASVTAGSTGGGVLTYWTDALATTALTTPTATTAGTYYIQVTATGGCTDIDPVTTTVNPLPVSNAGTDVTICSGTAASIGVPTTAGNGYSWTPTAGLSSATVSDPSITTVNSGTTPIVTTYAVTTTTIATGCFTTDSVVVTVNPQPVLAITNPAAVCSPSTVNITPAAITAGSTGGGVLTYWTDALATTALTTPAAVTTTGTYYIQVTATGGCTDIDPVSVVVNPLPVSNAGTDVLICTGTAAAIGTPTVAGTTYAWSPATGLSSSTVSDPSITTTNTGTAPIVTTYVVTTTTTATGCFTTDTVVVTVNPFPVLATTDPAAVCFPSTVDITAAAVTAGTVGSGAYTYWLDAAATTPMATPAAVPASGTYYIQLVSGAGCSDLDSVVVVVNPLPVSNAGADLVICTGSSGPVGAAGNPGDTYLWSPGTGLTSTTNPNPNVTLTNISPAPVSSDYVVTTTTTATGCQTKDTVTVTVNIVATANAGSSQSVCSGASLTLGGAVGGSASGGTWGGGAGTFAPNNTTLNAIYTPSAAEYAAGTVTLTLTTDDPSGPCTFASSSVTFFFYENPVVAFMVDDPNGCPIHCGNFTDLSTIGGGDNIVAWDWSFGDGSPDSTTQNTSHCYSLTGFYDVTLTATSNHGCVTTLTNTHMIQVYAVPVAEFSVSPFPATVLDPEITLNNESSPDVVYWNYQFGDGDSIAPATPSPVHMYADVAAEYTATLTVYNADGCYSTISHPILIGPEFTFFIPNAFTPNGDGVNDFFFGQGIGIKEYDIYIFDRWGNMIYHGDNINSSMWDGKANHGDEQAQQDVYVWKVKLTDVFGKKHNYMGTVTLVK